MPKLSRRFTALGAGVLILVAACTSSPRGDASPVASSSVDPGETDFTGAPVTPRLGQGEGNPQDQPEPELMPEPELITVTGQVVTSEGHGVAGVKVTSGQAEVTTSASGRFRLVDVTSPAPVEVNKPVWRPSSRIATAVDGEPLTIEMEPVVVRALRVSRYVAADRELFDRLMGLTERTTVNAVVFDTKDEDDTVLYETGVAYAHQIGAVDPVYDPAELLAEAKDRGLYTITRVVTFEDSTWVKADPQAKLGGAWVDASNRDNWDYPIALAVEACEIGFDEIQFDYVRFPAGRTGAAVASLVPSTPEGRAAVIQEFLAAARSELHPQGCGVSAAVFGITMTSATDEGIGQTPETISSVVDAISPMLYPSHYGPGWLGFSDPNDHPGPVIANALDVGGPRVDPTTLMRPWIQGFYYNSAQVLAQIAEAESRGAGWIIWNASGNYREDWLPVS